MPSPITPTGASPFAVGALGNPSRTLGGAPTASNATELIAALDAKWPRIAGGSRPTLSKAEAAWLVALANHPQADARVWKAILAKLGTIALSAAVRRDGVDAFITELRARTGVAQPNDGYTPGGSSPAAPTNGGSGGSVTDVLTGAVGLDYDRPRPASKYKVSCADANLLWARAAAPAQCAEDLFSTNVPTAGGATLKVRTHCLEGEPVKVIAYDNAWGVEQKDITRFFAPGEVFICVKHHKPQHPVLGSGGKEDVKFDSTHIEIGVGVETTAADGKKKKGAVTINNPQDYENGLFGTADYPMIFLKLKFPGGLGAADKAAYLDNIRTWLVIANTFTNFPGNYNGGDPLATRSVKQVAQLGDKLLEALVGTAGERQAALSWLQQPDNQVYCAELAHVAVNLGINYPLSKKTLGGRFDKVKAAITAKAFLRDNSNDNAKLVDLKMAPDGLVPMVEKLGVTATEPTAATPFGTGLALRPMTLVNMIEEFIQTHVPRSKTGTVSQAEATALAGAQAALFQSAVPGILESLGMDRKPATDPQRQAIEGLISQIQKIVATPYTDYAKFRADLSPWLDQAAQVTGPRPNGAGAFMPPHAWLLHALGKLDNTGGLMGVEVVGHGLHASILEPKP